MMTTFKGVRQPIVSKNDVRKELLSLMRKKADALLKASDKANIVITEGIQPTSGEIKINTMNTTPYGSIIQERTDGNGYQEFDAKTLIGCYITTISGSNNVESNKAIIATLYNQSKAYSNSEDHSLIIKNIKNIVIGKIRIAAEVDDKRYCDEINTPSISKMYSSSNYNNIGVLSELLDTVVTASEYERLQLRDTTKIFELLATKSGADYKLSLGNETTSIKADILPINKTTLFFDHALPIKSYDTWAGSEVDNLILTTDNIINGLSGKTINTTIDISGIQIKYFGTYSSENNKNVTFYSVNNGKIKWGNTTKTKYDISTATTDDLSDLSDDPNINVPKPIPSILKSIQCNAVKRNVIQFNDTLRSVIDYLEGSYCSGGINCGSTDSGETLWGLDRKNHKGSLDNDFWLLVDNVKNKQKKWNSSYPKPNDYPNLFNEYAKIIKIDYDNFTKSYITNNDILTLIQNDGRLQFNMIYAVFNGAGWFKGFYKLLENAYNSGKKTSDQLLEVFVNERVAGGKIAFKYGTNKNLGGDSRLITQTGYKIQKLVGLSPECFST
jgi:hypothetical protein